MKISWKVLLKFKQRRRMNLITSHKSLIIINKLLKQNQKAIDQISQDFYKTKIFKGTWFLSII